MVGIVTPLVLWLQKMATLPSECKRKATLVKKPKRDTLLCEVE